VPDDPPALAGLPARFDHVAIAGTSFEAMLPLYRDALGGRVRNGGVNTVLGFATVNVDFAAGRHVELVAPVEGSAFLDGFLRRTGGAGGLHHVTFLVPDIRAAVAALQDRGYATFGENLDDPVWAEAFVHPRDSGGVLLQVARKRELAPGQLGGAWTTIDVSELQRPAATTEGARSL